MPITRFLSVSSSWPSLPATWMSSSWFAYPGSNNKFFLGITDTKADGLTPREQLVAIHRVVTQLYAEATSIWQDELYPQLEEAGIQVLNYSHAAQRGQRRNCALTLTARYFPC